MLSGRGSGSAENPQSSPRPIGLQEAGLILKSHHEYLLPRDLTEQEREQIHQAKERLLVIFDRNPHVTPPQFEQSVFFTALVVILEQLGVAVKLDPSLQVLPADAEKREPWEDFPMTLHEALLSLRMVHPFLTKDTPLTTAENNQVQAMILRFVKESGNYSEDTIMLDNGSRLRAIDELHALSLITVFRFLDMV